MTKEEKEPTAGVEAPQGVMQRILNKIEVVGNKLPQPVTLFAMLIGIVLVLSVIFGNLGISAEHPSPDVKEPIEAVNLLTAENIRMIMTSMVEVFASFPPLGLVLVVMLGIGVAERSGLIAIALRVFVAKVPKKLITFSIVIAGMVSSVAADAGYVVLIPLGAAIFKGMGRHPLAGLAAAFAGVSGGFGANFLPTGLDPMIAAFTQSAASIMDPLYTVNPLSNYYLMAASVPLIGLAGTWVTEKIIVPRLGNYEGEDDEEYSNSFSRQEKKGLLWAGISIIGLLVLIAVAVIPSNGVLRGDDGSMNPFYNSIVPLMFILFFVSGLVYGLVAKTIKGDKDVANMTAEAMGTMGGYIVLAFVAAHLVQFFIWSNLGSILAISGAAGLQSIGFTGIPLLVAFILVSSFINLIIGSASAKWAILAPIFVPMLMLMGYSPETTQAAYRIGDSYSNILTPLLPYFPLVIVFAQKYVKNIGIGTIISVMLPYAIAFMIVRIPMFIAWLLLNLPLGIEGPIYYP
ncbi:MAG: AbgT family transporter [Bacteroidales bacterium]|nr:AbgT family transporter [Bacteroidales bacterium]